MGNTHSVSSTRRNTQSLQPESHQILSDSNTHPQDVGDSSEPEVNRTPIESEEGRLPPGVIQRRRSLMNFPSLRRRPWSVAGSSDESPEPSSASPSRRPWRAFSGPKNRPASTVAGATTPAADTESPQDGPQDTLTEPKPDDKGKGRENDFSESAQTDGTNDLPANHNDLNVPGPSTIQNNEIAPSSEGILQELRDLQDTLSTRDGPQADGTVDSRIDTDTWNSPSPVDRPLTPIPSASMTPVSGPRGSETPDNASHSALAEALGAWLGGRPRTENIESTLNDSPNASSSRTYPLHPSSRSPNSRPRLYNTPDSLNSSRAAGRQRSPFLPGSSPGPYASGGGAGRPSSSPRGPTLPPAGTGTLVVVQGVVHTTDVRQSSPRTPQPAGSSSLSPSISRSSTPTLRASPLASSSRSSTPTLRASPLASSSRSSTPQPSAPPRRSRFSSLTSGFRQRSRPLTPTSIRSAGRGSWRFGGGGTVGPGGLNFSENTSERSLGLGVAAERGASDSDTGSTVISGESSSTNAVVSSDDTSINSAAIPCSEQETPNDSVTSPDGPQQRNMSEHAETSFNANQTGERPAADDHERDAASDDEGEAELSASSIEILGTLLSVATAATAASLVSGTTEPLFSSGLAGLPNATRNPTPVPTASTTSPRPSFPSTLLASPSTADSGSDTATNPRMRAAWGSLRDRFSRARGRRGGAAGDTPESREDPREQMLREMARVFNMGLGLQEDGPNGPRPELPESRTSEVVLDGSGTPTASAEAATEPSDRPDPLPRGTGSGSEGSFEQFLHNLQIDLRRALTDDYAARRARAQARDARASNPVTASDPTPPASPESIPTATSEEGPGQETPISNPSPEVLPQAADALPNTPRTVNLDLPHLPIDGESPFADGTGAPPQAQGITGQPGAGINWWRLYRFPPMQLAPHPSTTSGGATSASGIPPPHPPPSASSSQGHSRVASFESQPPSANGSLPAGPDGPATQNVVPVIVVGLQSVPVSRAEDHHDTPPPFGSRFNDPPDTFTDVPGRDRPWPFRAAPRTFNRMGRHTEADFPFDSDMNPPDVTAAENAGAQTRRIARQSGRTYLIFVIGGYYPPNHSIVTGADDMNSFEALWELAELLGQVKPPVASKEDIEKSGLEIFKPSSLAGYEKSGKVASNTVERCLICLDDYEQDDDLRLLSCRHAFHKLCVDRWLEQGRNNCPACRSKGVQTVDDLHTPPTSPPPMTSMPFEAPL